MIRYPITMAGIALLFVLCASEVTMAQSWKHPPVIDYDHKSEQYSRMWEEVIASEDEEYSKVIQQVQRLWKSGGSDQQTLALKRLGAAAKAKPDKPEAHFWLGVFHGDKSAWNKCSEALEKVETLDPNFTPGKQSSRNLRFSLARCQLYSGNYESAIAGFKRIISLTSSSVEVELLLGESLMALGHLDQAIQAFRHAAAISRRSEVTYALAVALDRSENITESRKLLKRVVSRDPRLRKLKEASRIFAPPEDEHYYLGLAFSIAEKQSRALYHFRLYQKRAPSSPWQKRTEDHLRALTAVSLGEDMLLQGSTTWRRPLLAAIQLRRAELIGCLQSHPLLLARVQLSMLAAGSHTEVKALATIELQDGVSETDAKSVVRCLESVAHQIKIPRTRAPRGIHAKAEFWFVSDQ